MPQLQLPIFSGRSGRRLTARSRCKKRLGRYSTSTATCLCSITRRGTCGVSACSPVRMIAGGTVKPQEIVEAFGVPMVTVKRYVRVYREQGYKGSMRRNRATVSASVLKGPVLEQAQQLLDEGRSVPEVAAELKVLPNTLHKAIPRGPFTRRSKKSDRGARQVTNQSERSQTDSQAPMGNGATRSLERVAARWEHWSRRRVEFHRACDVAQGGVLLALRPCWRRDCCAVRRILSATQWLLRHGEHLFCCWG